MTAHDKFQLDQYRSYLRVLADMQLNARLLEDELTAITLKHVHGWKVAEVAQHLGRSSEAVAGLLRRGLKKLRKTCRSRLRMLDRQSNRKAQRHLMQVLHD